MKSSNPAKTHLFGLDNKDGHKRLTRADRFSVVGGSAETHEKMTETVIKTFETLDRRGKPLETVDKAELRDIIVENTPS